MSKKTLIVAALVAGLSVCSANATSTISGITDGGSGTFNIDPTKANGDVGFRYYDDFKLGQGDIANLLYQYTKSGNTRDLNTFINLVGNKIDINGIVNTMRGNNFYNGHAVFISPKGMVVGASGVLNVGTLSIVTPTDNTFSKLKSEYDAGGDYKTLTNISTLRNGKDMNYGGNAPVDIQGKILTRGTGANTSGVGVDIRGSQVNIGGTIVNGYNGTNAFTSNGVYNTATDAEYVFNQLVNTDGTIKAGSSMIADDAGRIVIKSGAGAGDKINIESDGLIANLGNTETAITNHGSAGLNVSGAVVTNGKLNVFNNQAGSNLTVNGRLVSNRDGVSVTSSKNITVAQGALISAEKDVEIVSNGKPTAAGSGLFNFAGTAKSNGGNIHLINKGTQNLTISGKLGDDNTNLVRIVNENGKLTFTGTAAADKSVSIRNRGTLGMEVSGVAKAGEGVYVENSAGNATLNGLLEATNVAVYNKDGAGKLATGLNSTINGSHMVAIKNASADGMELTGTITNEGEVAINNLAGHATVGGTIENTGNMGIINKGNGTGLTVNAKINNEGKLKLVNSTGADGLTVNGTVNNSTGNMYVYNDAGHTTINGTLNNTEAGNLYVLSRANATGITTGANSVISNESGDLAIKHNGASAKNGVGMDLNGTVKNDGEIAINNFTGDMKVAGTITETGNRAIGIINRAANEDRAKTSKGGGAMTVNATINGRDINIKNNGTGDMTVNGEITHNGRLNVLANEGNLIMGGKIHNTGTDMTYAAARANGDGIEVKSTFAADSTNGGLILIKNITGQNGLKYDGSMTNTKGQAEVYNKAGNMTVNGAINAGKSVVLNTGNKLTVTDNANLKGDVVIVNKGSEKAVVADKYKNNFKESLK